MTTYDVYFRSDLQWSLREFIAETPEQALQLARKFIAENLDGLVLDYDYEGCDCAVNEIEVCDKEQNSVAVWYDDDMRLRLAAIDLLSAAEKVLDRWQNGDIGEVIHELAAAVDAAKGGAA
jgi:hypothetical protein